jgi:dihydrolipoamide dehydrogenase
MPSDFKVVFTYVVLCIVLGSLKFFKMKSFKNYVFMTKKFLTAALTFFVVSTNISQFEAFGETQKKSSVFESEKPKEIHNMKEFDIAIIGGGPGGYVTAIKAGQMGKSVVCIDNSQMLGGTCLNVGCIPSKALLHATHKYSEMKSPEYLSKYGIKVDNVTFSLEQMMSYKNQVISELDKGIKGLFKKNKVEYIQGVGSFINPNTIEVKTATGEVSKISAKNVIIATGSSPASLPGITIDEKRVVSSTGALSLTTVPQHMVVIGAGVIGLEMGSVWSRLGSKVTVIEYGDSVLGGSDADVSAEVQKILTKQGLSFIMGAQVTGVDEKSVKYKKDGQDLSVDGVDIVLVAVGRKPNTNGLGIDKIGLQTNAKGQIEVDQNFKTSVANVYAIGDVIPGPMLAHKASEEGVALIEILCGKKVHLNYNTIPNIVYTAPEIGIIGKTEKQLKAEGIGYKVGKFNFTANSRSKAVGDTGGFVKVLVDDKTDEILGAAIINNAAGEMIHEIGVAMEFRASSEDIARISHGHPTMSEAIKEAMLAAHDKPIHN